MSTALKFHHRERLKRNRRWYWGHARDLAKEPKYLSMAIDTPTPCSRLYCQRDEGPSMQERRSDEAMTELTRMSEEMGLYEPGVPNPLVDEKDSW